FRRYEAAEVHVKRRDENRHDLERPVFAREPRARRGGVFEIEHLKLERVLGAVQIFVGEEVAFVSLLQSFDEIFVRLDGPERRLEVLQRRDERILARAVRRAEKDIE